MDPLDRPHLADLRAHVGEPGSRALIPTPAAVLDLDAFERNLARMQARADAAGLALRPHAKSHRSATLARLQIAAGAVGVCCAKLAEAEALAAGGIGSILVTSPIAGEAAAARAARLSQEIEDLRIVVDHVDGVGELAATGVPLRLVIDVDVGLGRTGVHDAGQAADVARAILRHDHLSLLGVQGYGGHWQHMEGANARADAVAAGMARLVTAAAAIQEAGGQIHLVTGGGTGTFAADAAQGVLNEVQPGSYAFMDRQYRDALKSDPDGDFEQALTIVASVISANHPKWVTVDAGLKAFATDAGAPVALDLPEAAYSFFGDEHGRLVRPQGHPLHRGQRVAFAPPHVDPTLDRYDVLHLVRGDVLEAIVPLEARGASQ